MRALASVRWDIPFSKILSKMADFALSHFTRATAVFTAVCFILTGVCGQVIAAVAQDRQSAAYYEKSVSGFALPNTVGRVTDAKFRGSDTVVVAIQDLHCHPEVQKNISRILSFLSAQYQAKNVYLEGAWGTVNTGWLTSIKDKAIRRTITENLVDSGQLTGVEYFAANCGGDCSVRGLENEKIYKENSLRLKGIMDNREDVDAILAEVERNVNAARERFFNTRQNKMEELVARHKAGELESGKYYRMLVKYGKSLQLPVDAYTNITGFLNLLELERGINYKKLSKELNEYVQVLRQTLPYAAYQSLMERTENFSKVDEVYMALAGISKTHQISLDGRFPEVARFFRYLETGKQVNPLALVREENHLVGNINYALSVNKTQREIIFLCDFSRCFKDFYSNKITAADYDYFTENIREFNVLYSIYGEKRSLARLEPYYTLYNDYYKANIERNACFVHNILSDKPACPDNAGASSPAGSDADKVCASLATANDIRVVVTGGFHTEGLTDLLDTNGISYLTITPSVTQDTKKSDMIYARIIEQQNKILSEAFAFIILSLQPDKQMMALAQGALPGIIGQLKNNEITREQAEDRFAEILDNPIGYFDKALKENPELEGDKDLNNLYNITKGLLSDEKNAGKAAKAVQLGEIDDKGNCSFTLTMRNGDKAVYLYEDGIVRRADEDRRSEGDDHKKGDGGNGGKAIVSDSVINAALGLIVSVMAFFAPIDEVEPHGVQQKANVENIAFDSKIMEWAKKKMPGKTLWDIDRLEGKWVLVSMDGRAAARDDGSLDTVEYLSSHKAITFVTANIPEPMEERSKKWLKNMSALNGGLKSLRDKLERPGTETTVHFNKEWFTPEDVKNALANGTLKSLKPGDIVVLNKRKYDTGERLRADMFSKIWLFVEDRAAIVFEAPVEIRGVSGFKRVKNNWIMAKNAELKVSVASSKGSSEQNIRPLSNIRAHRSIRDLLRNIIVPLLSLCFSGPIYRDPAKLHNRGDQALESYAATLPYRTIVDADVQAEIDLMRKEGPVWKLVRPDWNVSVDKKTGTVKDDERIRASVDQLTDEDINVVAVHWEKPQKAENAGTAEWMVETSIDTIVEHIRANDLFPGKTIHYKPTWYTTQDVFEDASYDINTIKPGDLVILNNARQMQEEEQFAKLKKKTEELAALEEGVAQGTVAADDGKLMALRKEVRKIEKIQARMYYNIKVFVLEGMGVAHRLHLSTGGAPKNILRVIGKGLLKDLMILDRLLASEEIVLILGGAKVDEKIDVMKDMGTNEKVTEIIPCGGILNLLLAAFDVNIGKSLGSDPKFKNKVDELKQLFAEHPEIAKKIVWPEKMTLLQGTNLLTQEPVYGVCRLIMGTKNGVAVPVPVGLELEDDKAASAEQWFVSNEWMIIDLDPGKFEEALGKLTKRSAIIMNGTPGVSDKDNLPESKEGTRKVITALLRAAYENGAYCLTGGGDAIQARRDFLEEAAAALGITVEEAAQLIGVVTGGGSALEYLRKGKPLSEQGDKTLPAIREISKKPVIAASYSAVAAGIPFTLMGALPTLSQIEWSAADVSIIAGLVVLLYSLVAGLIVYVGIKAPDTILKKITSGRWEFGSKKKALTDVLVIASFFNIAATLFFKATYPVLTGDFLTPSALFIVGMMALITADKARRKPLLLFLAAGAVGLAGLGALTGMGGPDVLLSCGIGVAAIAASRTQWAAEDNSDWVKNVNSWIPQVEQEIIEAFKVRHSESLMAGFDDEQQKAAERRYNTAQKALKLLQTVQNEFLLNYMDLPLNAGFSRHIAVSAYNKALPLLRELAIIDNTVEPVIEPVRGKGKMAVPPEIRKLDQLNLRAEVIEGELGILGDSEKEAVRRADLEQELTKINEKIEIQEVRATMDVIAINNALIEISRKIRDLMKEYESADDKRKKGIDQHKEALEHRQTVIVNALRGVENPGPSMPQVTRSLFVAIVTVAAVMFVLGYPSGINGLAGFFAIGLFSLAMIGSGGVDSIIQIGQKPVPQADSYSDIREQIDRITKKILEINDEDGYSGDFGNRNEADEKKISAYNDEMEDLRDKLDLLVPGLSIISGRMELLKAEIRELKFKNEFLSGPGSAEELAKNERVINEKKDEIEQLRKSFDRLVPGAAEIFRQIEALEENNRDLEFKNGFLPGFGSTEDEIKINEEKININNDKINDLKNDLDTRINGYKHRQQRREKAENDIAVMEKEIVRLLAENRFLQPNDGRFLANFDAIKEKDAFIARLRDANGIPAVNEAVQRTKRERLARKAAIESVAGELRKLMGAIVNGSDEEKASAKKKYIQTLIPLMENFGESVYRPYIAMMEQLGGTSFQADLLEEIRKNQEAPREKRREMFGAVIQVVRESWVPGHVKQELTLPLFYAQNDQDEDEKIVALARETLLETGWEKKLDESMLDEVQIKSCITAARTHQDTANRKAFSNKLFGQADDNGFTLKEYFVPEGLLEQMYGKFSSLTPVVLLTALLSGIVGRADAASIVTDAGSAITNMTAFPIMQQPLLGGGIVGFIAFAGILIMAWQINNGRIHRAPRTSYLPMIAGSIFAFGITAFGLNIGLSTPMASILGVGLGMVEMMSWAGRNDNLRMSRRVDPRHRLALSQREDTHSDTDVKQTREISEAFDLLEENMRREVPGIALNGMKEKEMADLLMEIVEKDRADMFNAVINFYFLEDGARVSEYFLEPLEQGCSSENNEIKIISRHHILDRHDLSWQPVRGRKPQIDDVRAEISSMIDNELNLGDRNEHISAEKMPKFPQSVISIAAMIALLSGFAESVKATNVSDLVNMTQVAPNTYGGLGIGEVVALIGMLGVAVLIVGKRAGGIGRNDLIGKSHLALAFAGMAAVAFLAQFTGMGGAATLIVSMTGIAASVRMRGTDGTVNKQTQLNGTKSEGDNVELSEEKTLPVLTAEFEKAKKDLANALANGQNKLIVAEFEKKLKLAKTQKEDAENNARARLREVMAKINELNAAFNSAKVIDQDAIRKDIEKYKQEEDILSGWIAAADPDSVMVLKDNKPGSIIRRVLILTVSLLALAGIVSAAPDTAVSVPSQLNALVMLLFSGALGFGILGMIAPKEGSLNDLFALAKRHMGISEEDTQAVSVSPDEQEEVPGKAGLKARLNELNKKIRENEEVRKDLVEERDAIAGQLPLTVSTRALNPLRLIPILREGSEAAVLRDLSNDIKDTALAGKTVAVVGPYLSDRLKMMGREETGVNAINFQLKDKFLDSEFRGIRSFPLSYEGWSIPVQILVSNNKDTKNAATVYFDVSLEEAVNQKGLKYARCTVNKNEKLLSACVREYVERLNETQGTWKEELENACGFGTIDIAVMELHIKTDGFILGPSGRHIAVVGQNELKRNAEVMAADSIIKELLIYVPAVQSRRAGTGVTSGSSGMSCRETITGGVENNITRMKHTIAVLNRFGIDYKIEGEDNYKWLEYAEKLAPWMKEEGITSRIAPTIDEVDLDLVGQFKQAGFQVRIDLSEEAIDREVESKLRRIKNMAPRMVVNCVPSAENREALKKICLDCGYVYELMEDETAQGQDPKLMVCDPKNLARVAAAGEEGVARTREEIGKEDVFEVMLDIEDLLADGALRILDYRAIQALEEFVSARWQNVPSLLMKIEKNQARNMMEKFKNEITQEQCLNALRAFRRARFEAEYNIVAIPPLYLYLQAYERYNEGNRQAFSGMYAEDAAFKMFKRLMSQAGLDENEGWLAIAEHINSLRGDALGQVKTGAFLEELMVCLVNKAYPAPDGVSFADPGDARLYSLMKSKMFQLIRESANGIDLALPPIMSADDQRLAEMLLVRDFLIPEGMHAEAQELLKKTAVRIIDMPAMSEPPVWYLMFIEALQVGLKEKCIADSPYFGIAVSKLGGCKLESVRGIGTKEMMYNAARSAENIASVDQQSSLKSIGSGCATQLNMVNLQYAPACPADSLNPCSDALAYSLPLLSLSHTNNPADSSTKRRTNYLLYEEQKAVLAGILQKEAARDDALEGVNDILKPFYLDAMATIGNIPEARIQEILRALSAQTQRKQIDNPIEIVEIFRVLKVFADKAKLPQEVGEITNETIEYYRVMMTNA